MTVTDFDNNDDDDDQNLQKDLTCPMCSEILRKPKLLTCMHTFCENCVKPLIAYDTGELICPLCRHITKTTGSTSSLSTNFIAQNIIDAYEVIHLRSEGELKCNECDQDEAKMFCCDCYQRLCFICSEHHKRSLKFKGHDILEFDHVTRDHMLQGKVKCCDEHSEILKFYCQDCGHTICHDCTVSKKHNGHEYVLLYEVVTDNKEHLKTLVTKATKKRKAVVKSISEAEHILQNLNDVKENSIFLIEETFGKINNLLTLKKTALIEKLNARFDEGSKSVEKAKENGKILDEWINFTNTIIDSRCNAEIMDVFVNLKRQLEDISTMEYMKSKSTNDLEEQKQKKDSVVTPNPNAKAKPRLSTVQQILGIEATVENGVPYETHSEVKSRGYSRSSSISSQLSLTEVDASNVDKAQRKAITDQMIHKSHPPPRPPPPGRSRPSSPTNIASNYSPESRPESTSSFSPQDSSHSRHSPTMSNNKSSASFNPSAQSETPKSSKPLVFKKAFLAKRRFTIGDLLTKSKEGLRLSGKRKKSISDKSSKESEPARPRSTSTRSRHLSTSSSESGSKQSQVIPPAPPTSFRGKLFVRSKSLFNISVPTTNDIGLKRPTSPPPPPPPPPGRMQPSSPNEMVMTRSKSLHNLSLPSNDDIKKPTVAPPPPPALTTMKQQPHSLSTESNTVLDYMNFPEPPSRAPSDTSSITGSINLDLDNPMERNTFKRSSLFYSAGGENESHLIMNHSTNGEHKQRYLVQLDYEHGSTNIVNKTISAKYDDKVVNNTEKYDHEVVNNTEKYGHQAANNTEEDDHQVANNTVKATKDEFIRDTKPDKNLEEIITGIKKDDTNKNSFEEKSQPALPPPRNISQQNDIIPQPAPRFFAGITMFRQEIEVNENILNMILEAINDSCLITSEQDKEVAQNDAMFTVYEEIFKQ